MRSLFGHTLRWSLTAALVALLALLVVPAVGAKALKNGAVEGTLLSQAGKPVAGVTVIPHAWTAVGADWWTWEAVPGVTAVTAKNGSYKLPLPAGRYRILFVPSNLKAHAIEAYPDMPAPDFGNDVFVTWGTATRGISAILDPPAHIEGTVRDAVTGAPVKGIHLTCIFQGTARIQMLATASAVSDTSGHYSVWGLKPYAGFALHVSDPTDASWGPWYQNVGDFIFPPASEWPAGVRNDEIVVERTDTVKVAGTIVDRSTGLPIRGMTVNLHEVWDDGGWDESILSSTETDSLGHFAFTAAGLRLAPGTPYTMGSVLVEFADDSGAFYDMWYPWAPDGWSADWVSPGLGETANLGMVPMYPTDEPYPW